MTQPTTSSGAWIFVSHSHKDLDKVRRVRNALEDQGHNPLLFFLKCLGDDSEVDSLIRREIEARTHFILCDSPNARASKWVQAEARIIKGLPDREYQEIDLDDAWDVQLQHIRRVVRRATVSVSYTPADSAVAEAIAEALRDQDYAVFLDVLSLAPAERFGLQRNRSLQDAVEKGWALILLSPELLRSELVIKREVFAALEMSAYAAVVPVLARDRDTTLHELRSWPLGATWPAGHTLDHVLKADLTGNDLEGAVARLVRSLKTRALD